MCRWLIAEVGFHNSDNGDFETGGVSYGGRHTRIAFNTLRLGALG
jgi:hypothetical protein